MPTEETLTQMLSGKRVLITGGTGFIGQRLVPRLLALGAKVTVYTRNLKAARRALGPKPVLLDDFIGLDSQGYYAVINLAGAPIMAGRWTRSRKEQLLQSRIGTTSTLLEHLRNLAVFPEVVVSGSAIGYYGNTGERQAAEEAEPGEGFAAQLCQQWESVARGFEHAGARLCLLRTGIVLDAGGGALSQMLPPFKLGLGGPIGSGEQWMSWIHRDDLVNMILWLLVDHSASGPVNGVAPEPVRNRAFSAALAASLDKPCWLRVPSWVIRLGLGQAGEELLLANNRVVPGKAQRQAFQYQWPELSDALSEIVKKIKSTS